MTKLKNQKNQTVTKTQIVETILKKSNCDKTQIPKLWLLKNPNCDKTKNSNCEKNSKLKYDPTKKLKLKKLKKSNCDKTQQLKLWQNLTVVIMKYLN